MAWNFANWYVPLIEGCCHGTNVPVPYEDGLTFLESNEQIITIVNQLIDNNNEIPEIIKEEVKTEFAAYLDSDEGKQKIREIVETLDMPFINDTGDTVTGNYIFQNTTTGKQTQITPGNIGIAQGNPNVLESFNITDNGLRILNTGSTDKQIDVSQHRIVSLKPPSENNDAANKKYVDDKVAALGNVLVFKGVKATVALLPTTGNKTGDVWYVEATKSAWAWVTDTTDPGGRWDEFGPVINLEPYFKKADIVQTTGTATDKVMSQKASTDNFVNKAGDTITGRVNIESVSSSAVGLSVKNKVVSFLSDNDGDSLQIIDNSNAPYPDRTVHTLLKLYNGVDNTSENYTTKPYRSFTTSKNYYHLKMPNNPNVDPQVYTTVWNEPGMDLISLKTVNLDQINYKPRIRLPGDIRIAQLANPVDAQDAATKAYVDAHSGSTVNVVQSTGTSTTDVMSQDASTDSFVDKAGSTMKGELTFSTGKVVITDGKTVRDIMTTKPTNETAPKKLLGLDANGFLTISSLANPVTGLDAATKNYVDTHFVADESNEAMPVEIAVDPTTRKLKGALMTAYQSPTSIGGVVSNGEKTDNDTIPVKMDSDGKQWVQPIGITGYVDIPATFNNIPIPAQGRSHIIATLLGDTGADLWIKKTVYSANLSAFTITLNAMVPTGKSVTVCYLLF